MNKLILILFLISSTILHATPVFTLANEAYQHQDFTQAINLYKESLKTSQSFEQHFNLGNAYYENEEYGLSILHYEKALILEPRNAEALENLKKTYELLQIHPENSSTLEHFARLFSANTWSWICLGIVIIGSILFYIQIYCLQKNLIKTFGWICLFLTLPLIALNFFYSTQTNIGIVLQENVPLKVSPTNTGPATAFLAEGSKAKIIKENKNIENFVFIKSGNNEGWINTNNFQLIWK